MTPTPPDLPPEALAELQRGLGELLVRVLAQDLGARLGRVEAQVAGLAGELREARAAAAAAPRGAAPAPDASGMVRVKDVAARLELDPAEVSRMLVADTFPGAFKLGRRWRVPGEAVDALVADRQGRARRAAELRAPRGSP